MNPDAELIMPPCPISQQEKNWPLLAVSSGVFGSAAILGNQSATPMGLTVTTAPTKLAADVGIGETVTSGGDWADEEVQIEGDDDEMGRDNLNDNGDEQGEGWDNTVIELPPDLVSAAVRRERSRNELFPCRKTRVQRQATTTRAVTSSRRPKASPCRNSGRRTRS